MAKKSSKCFFNFGNNVKIGNNGQSAASDG